MLTARPDEFLSVVRQVEQASGIEFRCESYYRKKPCPDPALEPYYNMKSIIMDVDRAPDELLFSENLVDEVIKTLQALYPLYEYCLKFTT